MSLLRAEVRRMSKRRLTRWMLLLVVVLMVTVAIVIARENQKPGPAAVSEAEAAAAREFEEQQQWMDEEVATCEEVGADDWGVADCEEIRTFYPSQEEMVEWNMPPAFQFQSEFPQMITVFAALLSLFAFIVGASMVGAEWRSGGMMNLLLWRPRRLQVLGSKLIALLGVLLVLGVVLGAVWTAAFWQVATYRGITDGMTDGVWQSFGLTGIRGITLVLVAGTIGFALASLGRHTAMAMGAAIGAVVVGLAGVAIIGEMLQLQFFQRWMWTSYVNAWMEKSIVIQDWRAPCVPSGTAGECVAPQYEITWQMAGIGMAVVVVLLLGAAMWQMRRRDVT